MRKLLTIVVLGLTSLAATAGTTTYTGTGTYQVVRILLPLANGGAAVQLLNDTIATIEPSKSGFMEGECAGTAYLSPESEIIMKVLCTYSLNAKDGFVIAIDGNPAKGAKVKVLGGSGSFKDATGTGSVKRKFAEGNRGSYDYEFKITTP